MVCPEYSDLTLCVSRLTSCSSLVKTFPHFSFIIGKTGPSTYLDPKFHYVFHWFYYLFHRFLFISLFGLSYTFWLWFMCRNIFPIYKLSNFVHSHTTSYDSVELMSRYRDISIRSLGTTGLSSNNAFLCMCRVVCALLANMASFTSFFKAMHME